MAGDSSPLEIVLAHPGGLAIHGDDPIDLSLGGSETALVSMARSLSRLGHRVTVACNTGETHECGGVEYLPAPRLEAARAGRECDVLMAVRFFQVLRQPVAARMYGMWLHDMPFQGIFRDMAPALARTALCLFPSRFHLEAYEAHVPGLSRLARVTRNGIDFDALETVRAEVRRDGSHPLFLYASRPERGLAVLLREIWPLIRRRLPDAELRVSTYAGQAPREQERLCDELIRRSEGVRKIGPLTRRQFWRELAAATAVLYPTDFPESSCMVALEAQAMGTPIVTTGRFALTETVGCRETLVTEPWRSPAYTRGFVDLAVQLAEDPEFARHARETGRRHVTRESHSWDAIAQSWEILFRGLFRERLERRKAGVLRRLLRNSDVEPARRLVASEPGPVFHLSDLADLESRRRSKAAELDAEPSWVDFEPEALPPQLAETFDDLSHFSNGEPLSILDVGCFTANLSLLFARDRPWIRLTGVDGNRKAVAMAAGKAQELGLDSRARFLALADPHLNDDPDLPPRGHDVALLCETLEYFEDPGALLEWAESRARRGVVGYALHGPWEVESGEGCRLWHLGETELRQLMAGKQGLELRYFHCGATLRGEPLGGWAFRYRVDPRNLPGMLDPGLKILRTPPLPRISVTILAKNEEAHIRRAVESLEPVADEIVIGDTGSTDLTVAVLETMGFPSTRRRIVDIPFEDFAQARNLLASHADGDYILWQDADEAMVNAHVLRDLVDFNEHFDGFGIEQRHLTLDTQMDSDYPLRCFRPHTADGPLGWHGCIHELVEHRINEPPRRIMICPDVFVAHLGYLHEQLRSDKLFHRNWELLLKDRRENPERLAGYVLGVREYLTLAVWELKQAGAITEKAWQCLNHGFEVWHRHVRHLPAHFRRVAFPFSRKILALLAQHGLPLRLTGTVPFQAEIALEILSGSSAAPADPRPREWTFFADLDEMRAEIDRRLSEVSIETKPIVPPIDLDSAPELRDWSLPPELFDLEPF